MTEHPSHTDTDMRTAALLRIATAIETAANLDELLMLALYELKSLLDVPLSGVLLLNDDGETMRLVNTYPPRVLQPKPFRLADTPQLKKTLELRQPFQNHDMEAFTGTAGPTATDIVEFLASERVQALMGVPLVALDHLIGMLVFGSTEADHRFSDSEMALARLMAGQLAAAITSFKTAENAQRRTAELATLNDIAAAVTSSLDAREIYHLVVEKLNAYFRVEAGSLLMRNDETGDLLFVMTLEGGEEKLAGVRVPRGKGIVGYVAESQEVAIVHDPNNDPRFYPDVSKMVNYVTRSILCVPILVKGRTMGIIELINKIDGPFTDEEAERLVRMAATIGVALENARLFQQVTTGRDRLEAILNSTNDGILMADQDGLVRTANRTAAFVLHSTREAIVGRSLNELLDELRGRAVEVSSPSWLNDAEGAPEIIEFELVEGAERRFIRHFMLPVRDYTGAQIGQLALFQDISKERELAQLRDDYTGMLVHDLRAPLTAIMNGVMMVRRGLGGPISPQQQELLTIAHHSSQTMLEMINTLLDISKMEQGRMPLDLEPLSPYAVVDATLDRLRASAQNQNVQLQQSLALNLPLIEADREKVVRVLQNLLDNAIKFSPQGGAVTLGTHHIDLASGPPPAELPVDLPPLDPGGWLIFWIRDRGPGIPPQYHARIFEKFGQVRGGKVRGTGLGLTFCKLVVEAHGGRIWLESVLGQGSIFAFALPIGQDQRSHHTH